MSTQPPLGWNVLELESQYITGHVYVECRLLLKRDTAEYLGVKEDPSILASVLLDEVVRDRKRKGRRP